MPPDPDDFAHLWDMHRYMVEACEVCEGKSLDDLLGNRILQLAVERLIEIVGEACRKVSRVTTDQYPEIEWERIQAQRHVIAHDYGELDYSRLWTIIQDHGPTLIEKLDTMLPEAPEDPLPED